ncbi:adenylate/guanylate cyclase domain-containing protein [Mycolicibacterium diernhoferi]|uniref:Adenylate/guanylate cyclase domain-containing protein n=1 Tax=Mycolicibacterium diernhoferi TaxID=1801 RepID=A0A1Q4HEZ2_9MYCO|nr:adenylate/guanylate cyclase domain-containing protein [Mycolicibacterium diernhoferi]OJZ66114.1 adenylate/guanylate cyclase domain-containing protein [Mycolicibacterium diernhoferi]OPE55583.1 adenylate/guanylate cyclase domain-containing protein [Mycolicibacterium diernhoferi]PEG54525.1 adenylate/guanylate cyclase domain-containing protein [Mycolicibacterium diernhoferi]QYL24027.1 HAMP domain-containing protein [Mycolicibacterium diernhoferi]
MDRMWQWMWDRYAARYSWACWALTCFLALPAYLAWSLAIIAFERSDRHIAATAVTAMVLSGFLYVVVLPGGRAVRIIERWAAGDDVDRESALRATYSYGRTLIARSLTVTVVSVLVLFVGVGMIAGASGSRLIQYAVLGVIVGTVGQLITLHSYVEGALRPARAAIVSDTEIGDSLPRSRPTFAAWTIVAMLAVGFAFAVVGAILGAVFDVARHGPMLAVLIGGALVLVVGPSLWAAYSPLLQPIRELAEATERVASGDFSQRLPVVQDDDLGALAASFNRMQAGLAERRRLHAAFGTYVDPDLAARLLEQGDDVFSGERREVTVMFVDIRDFTGFAEVNTAEDTVTRLNALFDIVVPAVVQAGGHVNKFLGDGALAVFGAPNDLAEHADAAVAAAVQIHRLVTERFGAMMRIGIGINTGVVIAGTIGGGGKLEFTLIGDAVNVAARVEQLTKTTGDAILLTQHAVDALSRRLPELAGRGAHGLKGKSAPVQVFGLDPVANR